jgi:hypothetical protein
MCRITRSYCIYSLHNTRKCLLCFTTNYVSFTSYSNTSLFCKFQLQFTADFPILMFNTSYSLSLSLSLSIYIYIYITLYSIYLIPFVLLTPYLPNWKALYPVTNSFVSNRSQSYIETDGQFASTSCLWAPLGTDIILYIVIFWVNHFLSSSCQVPSLTSGRVCNLHCNHVLVRVAQDSYITASSEIPQFGRPGLRIYIPQEQGGPVQSQSHVTTNSQSNSMSWCRLHAALEGMYLYEFHFDIRRGALGWNL